MLRREVLAGLGAAGGVLALPLPLRAQKKGADLQTLIWKRHPGLVNAYLKRLAQDRPARWSGKKDFDRNAIRKKYGTGVADEAGAWMRKETKKLLRKAKKLNCRNHRELRRNYKKFRLDLKKVRAALAQRKRAIDAEIKRRAEQRRRYPTRGQNPSYNRALNAESRFLGDLLQNIDSQIEVVSQIIDKLKDYCRNKKPIRFMKPKQPRQPKKKPKFGAPLDRD